MRWDHSIDPPPNDRMSWLKINTKIIGTTNNVDNEAFGNTTIEKIAEEGAYNLSCVVTKIIELDNGFVLRVADGTKARIKSRIEGPWISSTMRTYAVTYPPALMAHSKNKYYVDVYVEDTDLLDLIMEIKLAKGTFLHLRGLWCGRKEANEDKFQFVLEDTIDRRATIELLQEGDERVKRIWERMEVESSSEESSQVNESSSRATTQVPSDFDVDTDDTDYVNLFVEELNKNLVNLDTQVVSSQPSIMSEHEKGDYEEEKQRGAVVDSLANETQIRQYEDEETSELYFIRMKKWQENVKSSSSYDNVKSSNSYDDQTVQGESFVYREGENIGNDEVIARQSSVRSSCSAIETFQYEVENGLKKGNFEDIIDIEMASEDDLGLIRFQGTSQRSTSISRSQSQFMKANLNDENLSYQTYYIQTKKIQERYRSQVKSGTEVVSQDGVRTLQVEEMQISNNNNGITTTLPKKMQISNNNHGITPTLPQQKQRFKSIHPKRKKSAKVETILNQLNTDESLTLKKRIKLIIPVEKIKKSVIQNHHLEIDSRQTEMIDLPVCEVNGTESLPNFLEVAPEYILGSFTSRQIHDVESHTRRDNNYLTENASGSHVCTEAQAVGDETVTNGLGDEASTDLASEAVWTNSAGDDVLIEGVGNSLKHPQLSYNDTRVGIQNSSYSSNQLKLDSSQKHKVGKKPRLLKRSSNRNKLTRLTSPDAQSKLTSLTSCVPEAISNIPTLEETTPSTHIPLHLLTGGGGGGLVYNHLSDSEEEDLLLLPSDAEKEDMLLLPSDDENIVSNDVSLNSSQNSGRMVTFSNESSKLTLEDLVSCHSGTHNLEAFVEAVYSELRGSYSELCPSNILFGRCLTCGKLEPLHTFPVDFHGVGYACCFRGGLTEVLRLFNVVLKLHDHTRGPSSPVFVRVTNQHVEDLVGCGPAKFQRLDGVQRLELVERIKAYQGRPGEFVVSVLKTECGQELDLHVVQSKILENP